MPDRPEITAEYERLNDRFASFMNQGNPVEAIATARRLVSFTRDHFGEETTENALWLRNLGIMLSRQGNREEARELLLRARDISMLMLGSDQTPYAICLIDLAELHLAEGNRQEAMANCQQAMTILHKTLGPSHPLTMKAQGTMARITSIDTVVSAVKTTSIST